MWGRHPAAARGAARSGRSARKRRRLTVEADAGVSATRECAALGPDRRWVVARTQHRAYAVRRRCRVERSIELPAAQPDRGLERRPGPLNLSSPSTTRTSITSTGSRTTTCSSLMLATTTMERPRRRYEVMTAGLSECPVARTTGAARLLPRAPGRRASPRNHPVLAAA